MRRFPSDPFCGAPFRSNCEAGNRWRHQPHYRILVLRLNKAAKAETMPSHFQSLTDTERLVHSYRDVCLSHRRKSRDFRSRSVFLVDTKIGGSTLPTRSLLKIRCSKTSKKCFSLMSPSRCRHVYAASLIFFPAFWTKN